VDEIFVGRGVELEILRRCLEQSFNGVPHTVLVEGVAGVGKTALIDASLLGMDRQRVLRGSGDELEVGLSYGLLSQLITEAASRLPPDMALLGTERVLRKEPLHVGAALVKLIDWLQGEGPIVVVVDDVHWGDVPSLQALGFALRRLHLGRVLAVFASRDDNTEHLPASIRGLLARRTSARLRLRGLNVEELRTLSAALGAGRLSERAAQRLHNHTNGNPLHARALLEEIPVGVLHHSAHPLPAPRSFSMLVLARLAACSPEAERLVVSAAVLGTSCPLALASRLADITEPLRALEQAVAAHLLQDHSAATERLIIFPHPLIRAAIYHDLGADRCASLHARAARLVDNESIALTHRVAAASGADPVLAAEIAALADRQGAEGSFSAAADNLLAAATLTPSSMEREQWVLKAVNFLLAGDRASDASALADEVACFTDSAHRNYVLARVAIVAGRYADAERLLLAAWRDEDLASEEPLSSEIIEQLALCNLLAGREDPAAGWARQALTSDRFESRDTNRQNGNSREPPRVSGDLCEASPTLLYATSRLPPPDCTVTDRPGSIGVKRRIWRAIARAWADDLVAARDELTSTLVSCQGQSWSLPWGLIGLGFLVETEYRLGAWDDAIAHADFAVSIVRETSQEWLAPFIHAVAALPLAARGVRKLAATHVNEAAATLDTLGSQTTTVWIATALALVALTEEDNERFAAAMKPLYRLSASAAVHQPGWAPWQALYVEALLRRGRCGEAEAVLVPFEAVAIAHGRRSLLVAAQRARGALEATRGNQDRAASAFQAGLEHVAGLPLPFEQALLEAAYGRHLRHAGHHHEATTRLRAARSRFAELDARPFLERCDQELSLCSPTPQELGITGTTALTPQELAVARLVGAGHTNRQAAAALVVSVKTVEYHLGNTYAKLGVSSRTQLALALRQNPKIAGVDAT
jgi:DNA-binding CsgD family transcriptional regulator